MTSSLFASRRRVRQCVVLPVTAMVAVAGCGIPTEPRWDRASESPDAVAEFDVGSEAITFVVEAAPVTASSEVRARLVPAEETAVPAPVAGEVGRLLASTGSAVVAGQPILEWAPGGDELDELRIEILERQILLAELEGRPADAAAARTELIELRARPADNFVVITSPLDGVIGRFLVDRAMVYPAGATLFTVGDPARTRVDVELTDEQVADLEVGSTLRVIDVQNPFAEPTPAVVTAIDATSEGTESGPVSAETERWLVSAELAATSVLAVGDRVTVDIDIESGETSRRLPAEAILDDGRGPFVLVVDDDDASEWRRVDIETGLVTDDFVELRTDLAIGTVVVVP